MKAPGELTATYVDRKCIWLRCTQARGTFNYAEDQLDDSAPVSKKSIRLFLISLASIAFWLLLVIATPLFAESTLVYDSGPRIFKNQGVRISSDHYKVIPTQPARTNFFSSSILNKPEALL